MDACPNFPEAWRRMISLRAPVISMMGAGFLIMSSTTLALVTAFGIATAGLGVGMVGPHVTNMVLDRAPAEMRARAIGLMTTSLFLGSFLNPYILQPVTKGLGIHNTFLLVGGLLVASVLLTFWQPNRVKAAGEA